MAAALAVVAIASAGGLTACADTPSCADSPEIDNEAEAVLARQVISTATGMVADSPDGPAAAIVETVRRHDNTTLPIDDDPCHSARPSLTNYVLLISDLAASPETVSPELEAGLVQAAENSGVGGLYNFVERAEFTDQAYPGLAALRERLNAQQAAANRSWKDTAPDD